MNLQDLPQTLSSAQRMELQSAIEQAIRRLAPDFNDALEILDALHHSLKCRYPCEMMWDVDHYFEYAGQALERGPSLDPEVDEMAAAKDSRE